MENIIQAAVQRGASDLHIKAGDVFRARINGSLIPLTKQRLTPEQTRAMIGARELALLPRHAVLVNVARGGVVDEAALTQALQGGALRGAGLDVFAREPLPDDSPLWGLPNVLVLPHVSGASHRFWRRQTDLITQNLRRYAAGEPLLNTVDKNAGY